MRGKQHKDVVPKKIILKLERKMNLFIQIFVDHCLASHFQIQGILLLSLMTICARNGRTSWKQSQELWRGSRSSSSLWKIWKGKGSRLLGLLKVENIVKEIYQILLRKRYNETTYSSKYTTPEQYGKKEEHNVLWENTKYDINMWLPNLLVDRGHQHCHKFVKQMSYKN